MKKNGFPQNIYLKIHNSEYLQETDEETEEVYYFLGEHDGGYIDICAYNSEFKETFTHELGHSLGFHHYYYKNNQQIQIPSGYLMHGRRSGITLHPSHIKWFGSKERRSFFNSFDRGKRIHGDIIPFTIPELSEY